MGQVIIVVKSREAIAYKRPYGVLTRNILVSHLRTNDNTNSYNNHT